jgi:tetratricopeptide (TPR) repeat protein
MIGILRPSAIALVSAVIAQVSAGCDRDERRNPAQVRRPPTPAVTSLADSSTMTSTATAPAPVAQNPRVARAALPAARANSAPQVPVPGAFETFPELIAHGRSLLAAGEVDDAVGYLERARSLEPGRAQPYIELARAHLVGQSLGRARTAVEQALEIAPSSSAAWNTAGRVELAAGDHDAAEAAFAKAAEANQNNAWAWNNLGYLFIQRGDYARAAEVLERATAGTAVTHYMWNNLGMAYEHLDRLVEARAAYEKAQELGSELAPHHLARLQGVESVQRPSLPVDPQAE